MTNVFDFVLPFGSCISPLSWFRDSERGPLFFKGQVAWISEKQRLPVKTSGKASFYGGKLHCGRFYDRPERDYAIYVHIDVNLDGRGWFAAARPSIVKKEIAGALAWNRGHLPFKKWHESTIEFSSSLDILYTSRISFAVLLPIYFFDFEFMYILGIRFRETATLDI